MGNELKLELTTDRLYAAQKYALEEFKKFEYFTRLQPAEQELVEVILQRFSDRYTGWIIREGCKKQNIAEPDKAEHQEAKQYVNKEEALALCKSEFKRIFGKDLKVGA